MERFSNLQWNLEKGFQNGKGKVTWANGDYYKGHFKNGSLNGKGTLWFVNGTVQKGKWKNTIYVLPN